MDRRTLLKIIAAATVAGCSKRRDETRGLRVVVAGAGIIGASIAYQLAKSGANVTVIDKLGPATHASRGTFAWINATWAKQPRHYHKLNQDGVANWKDLQKTLHLPVRWSGSLEWFDNEERQKKLVSQIAEQAEWGEPARMVGRAELATLEPGIDFGGADQAAYSGSDGAVDPIAATNAMLAAAERFGAVVRYPCELTNISLSAGKLSRVETSLGSIHADRLVLATGAAPDAGKRFAGLDIPQRSRPGAIAIAVPTKPLLNRVVVAPGIHMHQRLDGRIVLGEQGGAPQNEAHALRLSGRPNGFPNRMLALEHAERMMTIAKRFLPGIANSKIEDVMIGWRPLPVDGHPVLGTSPARPDVYLAILHSGVSLAPIVGQLVAHELLENTSVQQLNAFRPSRSFELIKRY